MKLIPVVAVLVAVAGLVESSVVLAQAYPVKPVRIVVSWPPGGSNDVVARVVAQRLTETLGQTFVVENRAGATGTIGSDLVAKSPPDGYTILVNSATHVANPHIYKKLPYDTMKDFTGIMPLAVQIGMLVVHPSLPVKNVKELIALAKIEAGPDRLGLHGHRQLHLGHHGAAAPDDQDEDAGGQLQGRRPGRHRAHRRGSAGVFRGYRLSHRGSPGGARARAGGRVRQAAEAVSRHSDGRGNRSRATR